jgi:hypothetical protein
MVKDTQKAESKGSVVRLVITLEYPIIASDNGYFERLEVFLLLK